MKVKATRNDNLQYKFVKKNTEYEIQNRVKNEIMQMSSIQAQKQIRNRIKVLEKQLGINSQYHETDRHDGAQT